MVLVRTEFSTYGGYTYYPWRSPSLPEKVDDSWKKTFTFSLDYLKKYTPSNQYNLITWSRSHGPWFGNDILLHTYQEDGIFQAGNIAQNSFKFTEKYGKVIEYEVFALIYE